VQLSGAFGVRFAEACFKETYIMTDKSTQEPTSQPSRGLGFFRQFFNQVRLTWALLRDERVPIALKVIPVAALIYTLSPLDIIPDVIPLLGQLDDLGILMTAMTMFNSMAPADVVEEHLYRLRTGQIKPLDRADGPVIDVNARYDK
jgi:uncharacterized membrane protein YkvA (DUF1232 family)